MAPRLDWTGAMVCVMRLIRLLHKDFSTIDNQEPASIFADTTPLHIIYYRGTSVLIVLVNSNNFDTRHWCVQYQQEWSYRRIYNKASTKFHCIALNIVDTSSSYNHFLHQFIESSSFKIKCLHSCSCSLLASAVIFTAGYTGITEVTSLLFGDASAVWRKKDLNVLPLP